MGLFTRLRWAFTSPEKRLASAEQRFFDAYNRGGAARHRELVIPLDFFSRPSVKAALVAWMVTGDDDSTAVLEEAWGKDGQAQERAAFYENVARFLQLLADPRMHRVTWRAPDGRLLSYRSEVFD